MNGLFLLDDTKDADTDEYAAQSGKKKQETTPDEPPLSQDGDKPASQAMLKTIESICTKHGTTPDAVCKTAGVKWQGITNITAGQMLNYLKQKYKDE